MPRGYDRPLYIQPFDHRGSFQTKMFGWQSPLSDAQTAEIAAAKRVIYDGFLAVFAAGIPKEKAGILVDEQFGAAILRDAASNRVVTACPAEKSGQEEFDFEYGEDFARHIEAFDPTFCKVLVRYNPQGDRALNERQAARLKRLSDFLVDNNRSRFMFELLVPPEQAQLDKLKGNKKVYHREVRPRLMVEAIHELQSAGVEPDLWKVEGVDRRGDCEEIVKAARAAGRDRVSCIVLGRGENGGSHCAGLHRLCGRSHDLLGSAGGLAEQKSDARAGCRRNRGALSRVRRSVRSGRRTSPFRSVQPSRAGTSILHGGLTHATRNDRPRPDGSQHGAPPAKGRPSLRGV
jgi:myo-inositol catabolism protein IolC